MAIRVISEEEFAKYDVAGGIPMGLTRELEWYEDTNTLGIVLMDNVDKDYSFVTLSYGEIGEAYHHPNKKAWHAVDMGTGSEYIDDARKKLFSSMKKFGV
jgi:hypothetical protein